MPNAVAVGDTFNAIAGCDKTISTCASRFNNAVNFRGEPYVPGMDKMLATASKIPRDAGKAFAPANIALVKYWGKRSKELHLPVTSSLSISLANKGTSTTIRLAGSKKDILLLDGNIIDCVSPIAERMSRFLDLFRCGKGLCFHVDTHSTIPIAAGLASSASAFASLVKALDNMFGWRLDNTALSILARLGSGSASRSIWDGFVEWQRGGREDGMDSHGIPLNNTWLELRIGLLLFSVGQKPISSSKAMEISCATSPFYSIWPEIVSQSLQKIKTAITARDFVMFASVAEHNAIAMHAIMLTSQPSICYWLPETIAAMHTIWKLRVDGLPIYFTYDAGPNIKLLFLAEDIQHVQHAFPQAEILMPFSCPQKLAG